MIISHLCPPSIPENILIRLQDCPSGDDGTAAQHHTARAWKTKIVNLAHAARSCKLLGAPATRALYSHYPGQDVAPMKKYLRTVRESPSLASLVRSATFIPWAWQHCDLKSINNYRHLALLLQACSRITALGICEPRQKGPLKDRLSVKLAPQIEHRDLRPRYSKLWTRWRSPSEALRQRRLQQTQVLHIASAVPGSCAEYRSADPCAFRQPADWCGSNAHGCAGVCAAVGIGAG